jgi:hypothetical protein
MAQYWVMAAVLLPLLLPLPPQQTPLSQAVLQRGWGCAAACPWKPAPYPAELLLPLPERRLGALPWLAQAAWRGPCH